MGKTTQIAVVPTPGFSHLFPIVEFSKKLVHLQKDFNVTCIIPTLGSPPTTSLTYLKTLPSTIDFIFLPPIRRDEIPKGSPPSVQSQLTVTHSLPYIHNELKSLSSRSHLLALVADIFALETIDLAKELKILSYVYYPSPATVLSLCLYFPKLDQAVSCAYRDSPELIQIPGSVAVNGRDLPDPFQDRSSLAYKHYLERAKRLRLADGVFVNSFVELEGGAIKAMQEENEGKPCIYPVGPIIQNGSDSGTNGSECLRWLDKQQKNSVVYVCFGSGGTLSKDQVNELALGLELSGQKFLWVVRAPSNLASAAYLESLKEDPLDFLPSGFVERTKEQGLVIPGWAPQIQVLSHNSTGGFLGHCGWNSTLESIVHGMPLIAWPLFAEQRTTAVLLTEGLKVALRPKVNERGIVQREEVAKLIRSLMQSEEGREIRTRMEDLKNAASNVLKVEEGSSIMTLSQVADTWSNRK